MSSFSIDAVWEETIVFLRRESALVLPLALATFGVGTIVLGFATDSATTAAGITPRSAVQILWFIPALFLTIIGNLAISLMALRSRCSVGEALREAITRTPVALVIGLLLAAIGAAMLLIAILLVILLGLAWPSDMATRQEQVIFLTLAPLAWLTVRLLVMWPAVADGQTGPIATLRRSLMLTRGNGLRSLAVTVIFMSVYFTLISVSQLALIPVIKLLGMATGQTDLLRLIGTLIAAFIGSVLMMGWTVYLAFTYNRLSA